MKTFKEIDEIFNYLKNHDSRKTWIEKYKRDKAFYDNVGKWNYNEIVSMSGTGQWSEKELRAVLKRGQLPITNNQIKTKINTVQSMEITTEAFATFKPVYYNEEHAEVYDAFSAKARGIQKNGNFSRANTLAYLDALIGGIGWIYVKEKESMYDDVEFSFERLNPLDVLWDYDDFSNDLSDSRFLFNRITIPLSFYQKKYNRGKNITSSYSINGNYNLYEENRFTVLGEKVFNGKVFLFEFYEKVKKPFFKVKFNKKFKGVIEEDVLYTFSKTEANKTKNILEITELEGEQIFKYVVSNGEILEEEPLDPIDPRITDFPLIPKIINRRNEYPHIPDGAVSPLVPLQIQINLAETKSVHEASNSRTIVTMPNPSSEVLKDVMDNINTSPDFLILPYNNTNVTQTPSIDISRAFSDIKRSSMDSMQSVSGVYNEFLGTPSYAGQSGTSQRQMQNAVHRNLATYINADHFSKIRQMRFLLVMLQNKKDLHVSMGREKKGVILNWHHKEKEGELYVLNNISKMLFNTIIDTTSRFETIPDEMKQGIIDLMNSPNAQSIMTNKPLLEIMQIPQAEAIVKAMKDQQNEAMQQQMMQQQMAQQQMTQQQAQAQ